MAKYPQVDKCPNCGINTYLIPGKPEATTPKQPIVHKESEERKTRVVKGWPSNKAMPCNIPGCPFELLEEQDKGEMDVLDAISGNSNYA